jgi:two-component system sensor histidine kinase HydH
MKREHAFEALQEPLHHDELLRLLGHLASTLAHELRNPLNALTLHADFLAEEVRRPSLDRAQIAASVADMQVEINRMHDLVQDYLSLARLVHLRWEPVDLGTMLDTLALELQEKCDMQGITLHRQGLSTLGQMMMHRNSVRRTVLNLLHNAIDAMPYGGMLTLRGDRTASEVRIEVRDTGHGISVEHLALLFTPFHTTKPEGTGLGLYVAQQIVTAHGGKIAVTSTLEQGTTFTITLSLV